MSQALVASVSTVQDRDALPSKARGSQREPELDALRGLMLTLMTLAHLPTQAQVITNQQLGFVSEAEGFVFLSAFLTGRIFARIANESGFPTVITSFFLALHSLWSQQWQYTPSALAYKAFSTSTWRIRSMPWGARSCSFTARPCSTFCRCTSSFCWPHPLRCMWAAAGAGNWSSFRAV